MKIYTTVIIMWGGWCPIVQANETYFYRATFTIIDKYKYCSSFRNAIKDFQTSIAFKTWGQSRRCYFALWSITPKPSLGDILRATGGVLSALAIRHCWKHEQHPLLHGDTVPCFMEQSCTVWTDLNSTHSLLPAVIRHRQCNSV